jgi:predicted transcriptional regulator
MAHSKGRGHDVTLKEHLHKLVDQLPEAEAPAARRYLEYLLVATTHPAMRATLDAPSDEDELSEQGKRAVEEGLADLAEGRVVSDEDIRRMVHGE